MKNRSGVGSVAGIVLVGTHPWTKSAFDRLVPRALLPIAHRPLMSYALSWLHDAGIRDVAVCANRETRALQPRLRRHVPAGMIVTYYEDPMPRGAAGSVRDAAAGSDADTFVVTDGTAVPIVDLQALLTAHHESGAAVTVVVHAEAGRHRSEKPQVPSGTYVFSRCAVETVPAIGFFDIKEGLIPRLHRSGDRVAAYQTSGASPRVFGVSTYLAVNEWMVERVAMSPGHHPGYAKIGESLVHTDASVAPDAKLIGPVVVEAGARVMSEAVIVGPTSIGRDAVVGPGAFVTRSAVWRRCFVGERAMTDRCILADDAVVAAFGQAQREVVVRHRALEPTPPVAIPSVDREPVSVELYRRVVRGLMGASWSRSSPAAQ